MHPRRICIVAPYAGPVLLEDWDRRYSGGAEVQQVMLAGTLADRGHEVSFIIQDAGAEPAFVCRNIRVLAFRSPHIMPGANAFVKCARLWKLLLRIRPEVIYQRMADWTTGVCAAYARRFDAVLIHAVASDRDVSATEPMDGNWWQARLYYWGLRRASLVLAQHTGQAESLARDFAVDSEVFPSVYMDCDETRDDCRSGVIWIAMMRPNKRPELLLELARRLPDVPFTMIGGAEGDPASRRYFNAIQDAARGVPNVRFLGFQSPAQIDHELQKAFLLVSTTQPKREGLPVVFLQAWRAAVPAVGFSAPGLDEVLAETGWAVETMDEFTRLVARVRDEPALFASRGRQARQYFRQHHAMSVVIPRFETLIERALSAHRSSRLSAPVAESLA